MPTTPQRVHFNIADDLERLRSELDAVGAAQGSGGAMAIDAPMPVPAMISHAKRPSILAHALSGAIGAVVAEVVLFPVDTVKVLVQTAPADEASGFFATVLRLMREKGVAGFYKGIGASLFKESVHSFNYWCWHGLVFRTLSKGDHSRTSATWRLVLNLVTKQLNWLCTVPFEVVASVNQVSPDSAGFVGTAVKLYNLGGVGYFYKGLMISLALAINPAITNTLITSFLRLAASAKMAAGQDHDSAREHSSFLVGVATGVAKFIATMATYPLIRAKVLQQTSLGKQQSPLEIWRGILQVEGLGGLWRGVFAMTYKTVLWNAFSMAMKNVVGPQRAVTPPVTPPTLEEPKYIEMGREAWTDDATAEKLDEVLQLIRGAAGRERVRSLEGQMQRMTEEMNEVKELLRRVVETRAGLPPAPPPDVHVSTS